MAAFRSVKVDKPPRSTTDSDSNGAGIRCFGSPSLRIWLEDAEETENNRRVPSVHPADWHHSVLLLLPCRYLPVQLFP